ncbi:MAG: glycine-rich protein, partial [Bacteroidota bacterium]
MKNLLLVLVFIAFYNKSEAQTVTTFSYTGLVQTFTVPPCVATITVDLSGAQGATAPTYNSVGGLGGRIVAVIPVTAGQVYSVYVGGQNFNGGGSGSTYGGVGGGATDIRTGGSALSNRVLIAGGGGGGGTNCFDATNPGGSGGGTTGVTGYQCSAQTSYVGTGGSQTAGG